MLDELLQMTPPSDSRYQYLLLLRHQLEVDEKQMQEAGKTLAEFEEAYDKLTAPANRIATFLSELEDEEGTALISLGDGEFIANLDPKLDTTVPIEPGDRIRINDAYAVLKSMGPHPNGPLVKIAETLADGRLRVSMDSQGMNSRVVGRGKKLAEEALKTGDEVRMDPSFKMALEHFPAKENREYFLEEIKPIPWEKIGGQGEVIQVIRDAIELPLVYPELYAKFGKRPLKGILLYGPPGCGKTLIGKATAYNLTKEYNERTGQNVKEYFMYINGRRFSICGSASRSGRCARFSLPPAKRRRKATLSSSSLMRRRVFFAPETADDSRISRIPSSRSSARKWTVWCRRRISWSC